MIDVFPEIKGCNVDTGKVVPFKEGTKVESFNAKIVIE